MKQILINDVRAAIAYACKRDELDLQRFNDDELLNCSLSRDLSIGNIRLINVISYLQQVHKLNIPFEVFRTRPDDTVKSFVAVINGYISQNN